MSSLLSSVRGVALLSIVLVGAVASGCSSSATPDDNTGLNGALGGVGGTAAVTGAYGTEPVKPVLSAYWIGIPDDSGEAGGGPFLYLFSAPVSCDQLSKADKWGDTIPAGTQVLEMIVGTTNTGVAAPAAPNAGANVSEVNYVHGGSPDDTRAKSGSVTLTTYMKGASIDGMVDVTFDTGTVKGTFHAVWCPGGHEH